MTTARRLVVRESPQELWEALLERWREAAGGALSARGSFTAALSGGRTPEGFYRELAGATGLPWPRTHLFLVDERLVAVGSPESNAALLRASLIDRISSPAGSVHLPPPGERLEQEAAEIYEREIRRHFGAAPPVFDLVLLGLGADGHTASLFPGSPELAEGSRLVVPVPAVPGRLARVSLALPVINAARVVVFLVTGAEKRSALQRVLSGDRQLPGALVQPREGRVEIFADRAACPTCA